MCGCVAVVSEHILIMLAPLLIFCCTVWLLSVWLCCLLLLQASLADLRVPDYVAEDPLIKVMGVTRDQVVEALQEVGFTDDLLVSTKQAGRPAVVNSKA